MVGQFASLYWWDTAFYRGVYKICILPARLGGTLNAAIWVVNKFLVTSKDKKKSKPQTNKQKPKQPKKLVFKAFLKNPSFTVICLNQNRKFKMEFLPSFLFPANTALTRWTAVLSQHQINATQQFLFILFHYKRNLKGYSYPFFIVLSFSVSQHGKPMFSRSVSWNSSINTFFWMLQAQLLHICLWTA